MLKAQRRTVRLLNPACSNKKCKQQTTTTTPSTQRSGLRQPPQLERLVPRRRHDAPPVRKHGNTHDLRRKQITKDANADAALRTGSECPCSVATHLPVSTFHTMSVSSSDPETTCRPSGKTATHLTYNEDTSSQKYEKRTPRAVRNASALTASPHIYRSRRPTP